MTWVQENWIILSVVALAALALLWWLAARRRPDSPREIGAPSAEAQRKPLEPARPDIVAAEPARFKSTEPAMPPRSAAPRPITPPTAEAASPERTAPAGAADNLQLLKGVGPKLAALLNSLGVTRFDQIAGWTEADIAAIDPQLGTFQGRITRDNWVDQAGYLARGDKAGFEAKYGALGGEL